MHKDSMVSALHDGLAGLGATVFVVGARFASSQVALDARALIMVAGVAFLVAGAVRGSQEERLSVGQVARICLPVLLGAAVLMMNDRHHRLASPIGLIVVAVIATACGILAREWWYYDPRVAGGIAIGALAALVVVPAFLMSGSFEPQMREVKEFELTSGFRTISSDSLKGRVVVLAFWASWCGPCREELPEVERAYSRYRNDQRVAFYAVDVGWYGESAESGQWAYAENHLDMPLAYDSGAVTKQFEIDAIPTLILIDAQGRERFVHRGVSMTENLEAGLSKHVEQLIDEEN